MGGLLERLGIELPIVQAGMAGLARHELAAAVSDAGGLGQIGLLGPDALERELREARRLTGRPVAVNLIVPLAGRRHWSGAAAQADIVVTHWGSPRRRTGGTWIHQCGSVEEALAAHAAGADAVIAQGREAGGHTRSQLPALELLARMKAALPPGSPVLVAGGVADPADVRAALDQGAEAAVLGTRFLMAGESHAHPGYRRRLAEGSETILTELWGLGWPAPHRVLPNATTDRWLGRDPRGPAAARGFNRLVSGLPLPHRRPVQHGRLPLLSPHPATDDRPASVLDHAPLYAGETVARIEDMRPAAELVRGLA